MRSLSSIVCSIAASLLAVPAAHGHGDLHERIERATAELKASPTNPDLYAQRAGLYREHREWKHALADVRRALELSSKPEFCYLEGVILLEAGMPAPAKAALNKLLKQEPRHAAGILALARTEVALGEDRLAVGCYTQALSLIPAPDPDVVLELARTWLRLNEPARALTAIDDAKSRLGNVPALDSFALDLEIRNGQYDAALRRIARMDPRLDLRVKRGEALLLANRRNDAKREFEAAARQLAGAQRSSARLRDLEQQIAKHLHDLSSD